jgi:hypothetical protein
LGLWEEAQAPPETRPPIKEIPSIHPTANC